VFASLACSHDIGARVDLEVKGIDADKLDSSRAICNLITGLREDLKHTHAPTLQRVGGRGYY
jgi:hypothetical protein